MKKVVLITGVSSGFGKQTAELLAANEYIVYGTLRKETETDKRINIIMIDLADPGSISRAVEIVLQKEGKIDILINNAGMHTGGPVETSPIENIRLQMDTNFIGMVHLIRAVLPAMRKQGSGLIINFSSIGGLLGLPFQAFYSASKFAIEGFSEALRMEINQFKIKVVLINPGDFKTRNSANRRNYLASTVSTDPYHEQFLKTLNVIEKDETNGWTPEIVAKKILKIAGSKNPNQKYIIGSFDNKLAILLKRILPGLWFRKIMEDHYKVK